MRRTFIYSILFLLFISNAVYAAGSPAPKSPKAKELYEKAITSAYHDNYKDAMEGFKKVTEIEPTYAPAYNGWGICLTNLGQYKDANQKFSKAVEIDPKLAKAYYNWGVALAKMKDHKGAVEKFNKVSQLEPKYIAVYQPWGLSLVELGKYDEAIEKFKKISQLDPKRTNDINKIIDNVKKMKADKAAKGIKKR